jgi:hypothetical protein
MTATTTSTIAVPAASISRLQASEPGHGQRACQQAKDAAARGGVVGVSQLLRKLLHIHLEKNSSIDWEAIRLQNFATRAPGIASCQAVALSWDIDGGVVRSAVTSRRRSPVPTDEITVQADAGECQFSAIRVTSSLVQ